MMLRCHKARAVRGYRLITAALAISATVGCQRSDELGPVARANAAASIREAFGSGSDEGGAADAAPTGTGWATLQGRFTYDGDAPSMTPYVVTKDQAACTINGEAPLQESLLVDPDSKGIANVVVFLRKASRVHESAQPTGGSVLFDQKVCVFLSHVLPVTLGQTMEIKNSDPVGHNTNIEGNNSFNQTIPADASINFIPQKEESIPKAIRCSIHPWMLAYYLPRKNGYYAVTGADGSFEIANVPAGEALDFQVWHESGTGPGSSLELTTPEAKELKWKRGRFKLTLAEDEVKDLQLSVPPEAFKTL